jgi:hypothetical protein
MPGRQVRTLRDEAKKKPGHAPVNMAGLVRRRALLEWYFRFDFDNVGEHISVVGGFVFNFDLALLVEQLSRLDRFADFGLAAAQGGHPAPELAMPVELLARQPGSASCISVRIAYFIL